MACVHSILCDLLSEIDHPCHHCCPGPLEKVDLSKPPGCLHVHVKPAPVTKVCPPPPKHVCCIHPTFELTIDMQQYQAEEIHVSTVNNVIVVEAKHEEKHGDSGHVTREFLRRCTLPAQNDINRVACILTCDGILKITAPQKPPCCRPGERIIPVAQTGCPAAKR